MKPFKVGDRVVHHKLLGRVVCTDAGDVDPIVVITDDGDMWRFGSDGMWRFGSDGGDGDGGKLRHAPPPPREIWAWAYPGVTKLQYSHVFETKEAADRSDGHVGADLIHFIEVNTQ